MSRSTVTIVNNVFSCCAYPASAGFRAEIGTKPRSHVMMRWTDSHGPWDSHCEPGTNTPRYGDFVGTLNKAAMHSRFWPSSHFSGSCGAPPLAIVNDYIVHQKRPD